MYRAAVTTVALLTILSMAAAQDARNVAQQVIPSTVTVILYDSSGRVIGTGSGFFVSDNIIATNSHVIDGADDANIKLANSDTLYQTAGVVAVDKRNDLVLLQINNIHGKPLKLSVSEPLEVGQEIYAVGSPKGLEGTIAPGIVSRLGTVHAEGEARIQITAPISPGSSGGPVVDKNGEVIGIAQASIREGQNLNFAIPAQYLARMLTNLSVPQPIRDFASKPSQTDASPSTSTQPPKSLPTICERSISSTRTPYETGNRSASEFAELGNRYVDEGKYEEAVIALVKATELNPKYHQAYFYLWRAYSRLGCIENQIIALRQAVIIKPKDAHYVAALATTLSVNGRSEEALEVYKEAIRLDPKSSMSYGGLGLVYLDLGRLQDALEALTMAVKLDNKNADAHLWLGDVHVRRGDKAAAMNEYKYLQNLDAEKAERLRKKIDSAFK